ncbi:hypothetical protein LPB137_10385 [Poseidonibacter parvus]|uniref:O-antigen ligase-related domain-containing protein n=2 Tax=Poseidonibacter parvus TaxID=1850254 RepID=A0A1P8KNP6_9BACT|nr:hypothetical protein LPB137_10385 [Poseidonibacter parvus]
MEIALITNVKFFISLGILLFAFIYLIQKRYFYFNFRILTIMILFGLIAIHSLLFSYKPDYSLEYSLKALYIIFCIILVTSLFKNEKLFLYHKYIIETLSIILIFSSFFLLVWKPAFAYRQGHFQGIFDNPNQLALYISVIIIPYFLNKIYLLKDSSKLSKLILFGSIFILVLSASRTGVAVTIIIWLILLIKSKRIFTFKKIVIAIILSVIIFLSSDLIMGFVKKNNQSDSSLLSTRTMLYDLRFKAIEEKPYLGWGYHVNEFSYFDKYHDFPKFEKGNTYLALIEEFGFFFASIIIIFFMRTYYLSLKLTDNIYYVSLILMAAIIHSNAETWIFIMHGNTSILFWTTLIIIFRASTDINYFKEQRQKIE